MSGFAFPRVGSLGLSSPLSSVLCDSYDCLLSVPVASLVAREPVPCGIPMIRSLTNGEPRGNARARLVSRQPLKTGDLLQGDNRLSQVPELPL